jgi:hypothetical protein
VSTIPAAEVRGLNFKFRKRKRSGGRGGQWRSGDGNRKGSCGDGQSYGGDSGGSIDLTAAVAAVAIQNSFVVETSAGLGIPAGTYLLCRH